MIGIPKPDSFSVQKKRFDENLRNILSGISNPNRRDMVRHLSYIISPKHYGHDYCGSSLMTFVWTYSTLIATYVPVSDGLSQYETYLGYLDKKLYEDRWDLFGGTIDCIIELLTKSSMISVEK